MPIRVRCTNSACGQEADVPDTAIGKSAKCRGCGTKFVLKPIETAPPSPGKASATTPPPTVGERITRFEIRKELGSGAFGTVYLAFDPQLQREVALKVPNANVLKEPRRIERFLREARAAAKLRHPNIVPVYDAGQADGRFYIASAFVKGESLEEVIDSEKIDPKKAARIVRSLAEALAYAHREGIVHRDVKPANVMIDETGEPLLMDFGLAARVDAAEDFQLPDDEADERASRHDNSRLTRAGSIMGTPSYMAPEIARGMKGEAQGASDQYSLGVVLFELLTGKTPFEGPPAVVMHQAIHQAPARPSELRKDVPADLECVCLAAMAKDPADRYVTCGAMGDDLRRWMDGEPVRARKLGFVGRTRRLLKQEPKLAILTGGALAAILLIASALTWTMTAAAQDEADDYKRISNKAWDHAKEAQSKLGDAEQKAEAADLASARLSNEASWGLAQEKIAFGDWHGAWLILQRIAPDKRNAAWAFLIAQVDGLPDFRRKLQAPPTVALDFDAAGKLLLQVSRNGELNVFDVVTGRSVRRVPLVRKGEEQFWHAAAMSANGERIATFAGAGPFGGGNNVPQPIGVQAPGGVKAPVRETAVVIWDEQGKSIRTIPIADAPWQLAMSRDGKRLAIAGGARGGKQTLSVWNVDTGERIVAMDKTLSAVEGPSIAMAFSPDGNLLAATTIQNGGEVRVWETESGAERLLISDRTAVVTHLAFSPDSSRLAIAGGGDRLEGPTRTITESVCVPTTATRKRMVDGNEVDETITVMTCKEVQKEVPGFYFPRMKTVYRANCVEKEMDQTITKQVMKQENYTTYETVTSKELRDGKEVTVSKQVPVQKTRVVCVPETMTVKVKVFQTEGLSQMVPDYEPSVRIWKLADGKLETTVADSGTVTALAWPQDALLLTAANRVEDCNINCACQGPEGDRAVVSFWDPTTGLRFAALPTSIDNVTCLALSSDGKQLAAGHDHFLFGLTLWNVDSRFLVFNGRGAGSISDLVFSPDGQRLASYSKCGNLLRLWDMKSGSLVKGIAGAFNSLRFLPGDRLVSEGSSQGCGDGSSNSQGRWVSTDGTSESHPGNRIGALVYSDDGKRFIASEMRPSVGLTLYDESGKKGVLLDQSFLVMQPMKLQISQDGSRVAALTFNDAFLWDGATGQLLARHDGVCQADLSVDGNRWVVATRPVFGNVIPAPVMPNPPKAAPKPESKKARHENDDFALISQVPEPKAVVPMPPGNAPNAPAPRPAALIVYDRDGKELHNLPGAEGFFHLLRFDAKGKRLVGLSGDVVKIWNPEAGTMLAQYRTDRQRVTVSADGRYLVIHRPQPLYSAVPMPPMVIPQPMAPKVDAKSKISDIHSIAFADPVPSVKAPDAKGVPEPRIPQLEPPFEPLPCGPCSKKALWIAVIDLANGQLLWNASVYGTEAGGLAFSANGSKLAMGYADGKTGNVQVWDTALQPSEMAFRFEFVARYSGHFGNVEAIAFSPDGSTIASGGEDRVVKVWRLPIEGEVAPGKFGVMNYTPRIAPPGK